MLEGVEYAWLLAFQADALLDSGDDVVRLEASDEQIVQIDVWICAPSVAQRPKNPVGAAPLPLTDGRRLWVGYDIFAAAHGDGYVSGRRDYQAAILEFADRAQPHVAPGLVLRPADIS